MLKNLIIGSKLGLSCSKMRSLYAKGNILNASRQPRKVKIRSLKSCISFGLEASPSRRRLLTFISNSGRMHTPTMRSESGARRMLTEISPSSSWPPSSRIGSLTQALEQMPWGMRSLNFMVASMLTQTWLWWSLYTHWLMAYPQIFSSESRIQRLSKSIMPY